MSCCEGGNEEDRWSIPHHVNPKRATTTKVAANPMAEPVFNPTIFNSIDEVEEIHVAWLGFRCCSLFLLVRYLIWSDSPRPRPSGAASKPEGPTAYLGKHPRGPG